MSNDLSERELDVLKEKYALLKQEVWAYIGFYKAHVRNLQLIGGAVLAAGVFLLSNPSIHPDGGNWWLWLVGVLSLSALANYLLLDVTDAVYQLVLLGQRMIMIEERVNTLLGRQVLLWESKVVPLFYGPQPAPIGRLVNPSWLFNLYGMVVTLVLAVGVPALCYWYLFTKVSSAPRPVIVGAFALSLGATALSLYVSHFTSYRMRPQVRPFFLDLERLNQDGPAIPNPPPDSGRKEGLPPR
jgi:hypothetical protein